MVNKVKGWLPWLLCCAPGVAVALVIGLGLTLALPSFALAPNNPALYALVAISLICPLTTVVGLLRGRRSANHCALMPSTEQNLATLRAEAAALQQRLTQLQSQTVQSD